MVSHPLRPNIDKICDDIKNTDFNDLKGIDFNKLTRDEKNRLEDVVYAMMAQFRYTPLELDNTMPKELYEIVESKCHYFLKMEKEIRESTLAQVMPDLTKGQITKANNKYSGKFTPKYRAFSILQNKIEDVVKKSTQIWRLIYGLTTVKDGEEDPLEGQEDKTESSEKEAEKEKDEKTE